MVQFFDKGLTIFKSITSQVYQAHKSLIGLKNDKTAALHKEIIRQLLRKCREHTVVPVAWNAHKVYMGT